jgi:tRNA(fMet)-specific endonuclease VapC
MTGNKCLLDTSIIIHAFRDNIIAAKLDVFSEIYVPSIAVGELYYGAYKSANPQKHLDQLKHFMGNCIILSIDMITADIYGSIKTTLKNKGKPIPENDIWIASVATQFKLPLLTTDNHFKEIENIVLVNF